MPTPAKPEPSQEWDPVFLDSRREALGIFWIWLASLIWVVPFCYLRGFGGYVDPASPEDISLVLGVPSWLFWGVAIPWLLANVVTTWFCLKYMRDAKLEEPAEDAAVSATRDER